MGFTRYLITLILIPFATPLFSDQWSMVLSGGASQINYSLSSDQNRFREISFLAQRGLESISELERSLINARLFERVLDQGTANLPEGRLHLRYEFEGSSIFRIGFSYSGGSLEPGSSVSESALGLIYGQQVLAGSRDPSILVLAESYIVRPRSRTEIRLLEVGYSYRLSRGLFLDPYIGLDYGAGTCDFVGYDPDCQLGFGGAHVGLRHRLSNHVYLELEATVRSYGPGVLQGRASPGLHLNMGWIF